MEDPYAAMAELARRPMAYWTLVLSLTSIYREELLMIGAVKRRWPNVEIWLTQTEGRAAALAQAMQLGADGLLNEEGLHRTAVSSSPKDSPALSLRPVKEAENLTAPMAGPFVPMPNQAPTGTITEPGEGKKRNAQSISAEVDARAFIEQHSGEPVLTVEELRALLEEPSASDAE